MIVKRVGVASVAKIYGAISGAFGLVAGLFLALASVVGAGLADSRDASFLAPLLGVGAVIALPVFYGVLGLVAGAIGAALYNLFAGMVGGVEIDVEQR